MKGTASNPLLWACNISWDLFVLIDGTDKSNPVYLITGTTGQFPAYEIYVGTQNVPVFDPDGSSAIRLCFPQQTISPIAGGIQ